MILLVHGFHQGSETSVSKGRRQQVVFEGDYSYNVDKMRIEKEPKACLYRSSSFLLCTLL